MALVEVLGLVATLFVLLSFLFKKMLIVRTINIVGCIFFVVYGLMLGAWSVWILNGALAVIHIAFILTDYIKNHKKKD